MSSQTPLNERARQALIDSDVVAAYLVSPLPRGVVSAARGGLALVFRKTTPPGERYERSQRLRFALMGLLPAGHSEMINLNDARLPVAAACVATGELVLETEASAGQRFAVALSCQSIDVVWANRRFLAIP